MAAPMTAEPSRIDIPLGCYRRWRVTCNLTVDGLSPEDALDNAGLALQNYDPAKGGFRYQIIAAGEPRGKISVEPVSDSSR